MFFERVKKEVALNHDSFFREFSEKPITLILEFLNYRSDWMPIPTQIGPA